MKDCQYCHKPMEEELTICPLCNNIAPENIIKKKYIPTFSLRELLILLGFWIFLGVAHNYLMYGLSDGISIPLFALLFLASLYGMARTLNIVMNRNMFVVWGMIFIFSLFQSIRVGDMLTFYNTIAIYFSSLLLLILLIRKRFEDIGMNSYLQNFVKITFGSFVGSGIWLKDFISLWTGLKNTEKNMHIFKGILMAIPLIFLFTMLFFSADIAFQTFLNNLLDFQMFNILNVSKRLVNIALFSLVFVGLFTFVSYSVRLFKKEDELNVIVDDKKHIEINIMLGLISFLFLTFILVQIRYLFGGEQMILAAGHTYAEYTTTGFQQLSVIALIVFILFWKIDDYLYSHQKPSNSLTYKWLSSLIICMTILILFSAFHRLRLYETTYGFTEIRFYGYVFIIVLWFSLLITLYKILEFIKEWHFLISVASLYGTALLICNIISPESFIAESNTIKAYRGSLRMDSFYIGGRSEDAIDSMIKTYDTIAPDKKKDMELQLCNMLQRLKKEYSWQEWNYAKYHAWSVLLPREIDLNCHDNPSQSRRNPQN